MTRHRLGQEGALIALGITDNPPFTFLSPRNDARRHRLPPLDDKATLLINKYTAVSRAGGSSEKRRRLHVLISVVLVIKRRAARRM